VIERWRRLVRGLGALPGMRRVKAYPRLFRLYQPLRCAPSVTAPLRFATRELAGRTLEARYRVRESDAVIHVRHPRLDMWVVDELFYREVYRPPEPVLEALGSLEHPVRIADLGAHVGMASVYFSGWFPGAEVTAFEPNASNADVLRRTIEANGASDRWRVIEAGAASEDGTAELSDAFHLSRISPGRSEPTTVEQGRATTRVRTVDVFPLIRDADLLKVDIQGGEWEILGDPRFRDLASKAIVLEYHPHLCPAPDPGAHAARLLDQAGFSSSPVFDAHGGEGTLWAWKVH
jgi:FkbM family methyltransferase